MVSTAEQKAFSIHRDALEVGIRISMYHLLSWSDEDLDNIINLIEVTKQEQQEGNLSLFSFLRLFQVQQYHLDTFIEYYRLGLKTPACCAHKCLVFPEDVCVHGNPALVTKLIDNSSVNVGS